jgi:hypothetical protein
VARASVKPGSETDSLHSKPTRSMSRGSQKRSRSGNERTGRTLSQMPAGILIAIDAAMISLLTALSSAEAINIVSYDSNRQQSTTENTQTIL